MKPKKALDLVETVKSPTQKRAESELLKVEKELAEADTELKTVVKQVQSLSVRGAELQQKLAGLKEKKNVLHTVLGYLDDVAPAVDGTSDSTK